MANITVNIEGNVNIYMNGEDYSPEQMDLEDGCIAIKIDTDEEGRETIHAYGL